MAAAYCPTNIPMRNGPHQNRYGPLRLCQGLLRSSWATSRQRARNDSARAVRRIGSAVCEVIGVGRGGRSVASEIDASEAHVAEIHVSRAHTSEAHVSAAADGADRWWVSGYDHTVCRHYQPAH